jgi:hypothetical protein
MPILADKSAGNPLPEGEGRVRDRPVEAWAVTRPHRPPAVSPQWYSGLHLTQPSPYRRGLPRLSLPCLMKAC